ncbi:hypothetical protein M9H77_21118 [Catharanthus roseus]|uniref:Uncharacterized protein n=1 Tax=Catharanthus roseus TaxID=4058 RepID=A0ACC0ALN9_CATRO|nr:hypothetical protein M9H77_21118 [Catharanthus roseus]
MFCGSGYFLAGWVRRGPPARITQGSLVMPRGMQVPYSVAVDLAEGYGFFSSCLVRPLDTAGRMTAKTILMRGTLEAQYFDISFNYGMLRVSYNFKLKVSTPNFSLDSNLSLV